MKVFVHLAYGRSQANWGRLHDNGHLIGINHRDAYGYRQAEQMGATVEISQDHTENMITKTWRLGWRWLLGFDIVHAYRNWRIAKHADVIWTHTESQFLAICCLVRLAGRSSSRPRLIAQTVWMIDRWHDEPMWRQWIWRRLVHYADVLTFHSPLNMAEAQKMFPGAACELVRFGIKADIQDTRAINRPMSEPLKLISVGSDAERDWATLISAVSPRPDWRLRIVSKTCPPKLAEGAPNITIGGVSSNEELIALYQDADIAIVPLKPNLHASGTTATQEAILFGIPLIATDVGGLRAYYGDDELCYVQPNDPESLRSGIAKCAADPVSALKRAARAQTLMTPDNLSSWNFVRKHLDISERMIASATQ